MNLFGILCIFQLIGCAFSQEGESELGLTTSNVSETHQGEAGDTEAEAVPSTVTPTTLSSGSIRSSSVADSNDESSPILSGSIPTHDMTRTTPEASSVAFELYYSPILYSLIYLMSVC